MAEWKAMWIEKDGSTLQVRPDQGDQSLILEDHAYIRGAKSYNLIMDNDQYFIAMIDEDWYLCVKR